jgi:hypothetical protein
MCACLLNLIQCAYLLNIILSKMTNVGINTCMSIFINHVLLELSKLTFSILPSDFLFGLKIALTPYILG